MRVLPILLTFALSPAISAAADPPTKVTQQEAKRLADSSEASLSRPELVQLAGAQTEIVSHAMQKCSDKFGTPCDPFTLVAELAPDGKVVNTWLIGTSDFGKCFRKELSGKFIKYFPSTVPFYTSLEYTFEYLSECKKPKGSKKPNG